MATFNFQVDRVYKVLAPLTLHPSVEMSGEPLTPQPGDTVIYRGLVELAGIPRYAFDASGKKGYARDRKALEKSLVEDYDALIQVS